MKKNKKGIHPSFSEIKEVKGNYQEVENVKLIFEW